MVGVSTRRPTHTTVAHVETPAPPDNLVPPVNANAPQATFDAERTVWISSQLASTAENATTHVKVTKTVQPVNVSFHAPSRPPRCALVVVSTQTPIPCTVVNVEFIAPSVRNALAVSVYVQQEKVPAASHVSITNQTHTTAGNAITHAPKSRRASPVSAFTRGAEESSQSATKNVWTPKQTQHTAESAEKPVKRAICVLQVSVPRHVKLQRSSVVVSASTAKRTQNTAEAATSHAKQEKAAPMASV